MGRSLAETARLNSPETRAAEDARAAVARASASDDRSARLARRHGRIFIGGAIAILLLLVTALLLPSG